MKLIYVSGARIPDTWAHVLQILTMCEAFAESGVEVELIVPRRAGTGDMDPYIYAGVERNFIITKIPCIDLWAGTQSTLLYWVRTFSFLIAVRIYLLFRKYDILYTREHQIGVLFKNFFYEVHAIPRSSRTRFGKYWKRAAGLVVLTEVIKSLFIDEGFPSTRIHVAPDAVKISAFNTAMSQAEARRRTNLPETTYLMGYVGTLKTMQMEKGVACAIQSLRELPTEVELCVVGGEAQDIEEYRELAKREGVAERVRFIGTVPRKEVSLYLRAFDCAVAPFPDFEHYRSYMSPLKIFEYMAAGIPMIVSDLPSLREVLSEKTTLFIPPADNAALARAVEQLRADPDAAALLARNARKDVEQRFSWKKRAEDILAFIMHE